MASVKQISLSFILLLWLSLDGSVALKLPQVVINEMAKREVRYHHYLWHNIRDNWNRLSPDLQQQIRDLGWEPPRPSRTYDANGNSIAITDNDSGEDFLYMHRQMIE